MTSCASNLKQMGIAFAQYEQDYDESLTCSLPGYSEGAGWAGEVYPYLKSINVFHCPDDQTAMPFCSYGFNGNLAALQLSQFGSTPRTVLVFEVAGNTPCDPSVAGQSCAATGVGFSGNGWDPSGKGATGGDQCTSLTTTFLRYVTGAFYNRSEITQSCFDPGTRHQQGANYLMADSHVKYMLGSQVSTGYAAVSGAWQVSGNNYQDQNPPNIWGWGTPAGTQGAFNASGTLVPAATFSPW